NSPAAPAMPTRKSTVPTAKIQPKNRSNSFIQRPFAAALWPPANLLPRLEDKASALCAPNQSVSKSGNRLTPPVLWSNLGFPFGLRVFPRFIAISQFAPRAELEPASRVEK